MVKTGSLQAAEEAAAAGWIPRSQPPPEPGCPRAGLPRAWRVQEARSEDPAQGPREPDTLGAADPPGSPGPDPCPWGCDPRGSEASLVGHVSPSGGCWGQVQETVWQENLQGPFRKACSRLALVVPVGVLTRPGETLSLHHPSPQ